MRYRVAPLCPADIGRRVTMRAVRRSPHPGESDAFDTVGTLRSVTSSQVEVEDRHGRLVVLGYPPQAEATAPSVIASRVVPPDIGALALQHIAQLGWPPRERQLLGEWEFRWSGGVSERADSVRVGGDPGSSLTSALDDVRAWYEGRGATPRLQVPQPWLVNELNDAGWEIERRVVMMTATTRELPFAVSTSAPVAMEIRTSAEATWVEVLADSETGSISDLTALLDRPLNVIYVSAMDPSNGEIVGTGRASVAEGWCGITSITTAPAWQRRGVARAVTAELVRWAEEQRANQCYLQVLTTNGAARALYESFGFAEHHHYAYWRERRVS